MYIVIKNSFNLKIFDFYYNYFIVMSMNDYDALKTKNFQL